MKYDKALKAEEVIAKYQDKMDYYADYINKHLNTFLCLNMPQHTNRTITLDEKEHLENLKMAHIIHDMSIDIAAMQRELSGIQNIPYNKTFNDIFYVYSFKRRLYPETRELLKEHNYKYLLTDMRASIIYKIISEEELNENEIDFLGFQIKHNLVESKDKEAYYYYVFNQVISGDPKIDYETYYHIIYSYFKEKMLEINPDAILNFVKSEKLNVRSLEENKGKSTKNGWKKSNRAAGLTEGNTISLLDDTVKDLYDNGNLVIFCYFFHELRHLEQNSNYDMINVKSFEKALRNLKDNILSAGINNFYNNNYFALSFEADAYLAGVLRANDFLKNFGEELSSLGGMDICTYLNKKDRFYESDKRIMEGIVRDEDGKETIRNVTVNFNDLFDFFIYNSPKLLEDYPILNMEYKTDGEHVFKQNVKDLKNGLNEVNGLDFTFEEKDDIKRTYRSMIQNKQLAKVKAKKLTRNESKK